MLCFLALSWIAAAPAADTFGKAQTAYDNYEFAPAAQLYRKAIASGQLDPHRTAQARLRLGFSLFIAQDRAGAEIALADLFDHEPAFILERRGVHPDLLKFYDSQHEKWLSAHVPPVPPHVTPAPLPPTIHADPPTAPVQTEGYRPAPWPVRLIPLGVGQFANGDPVGGGIWLGAELALIGLNIVSSLEHFSRCDGNQSNCRELNTARAWFYVQDVSAGLLIATAVLGVVDALVWSPKRGEKRYATRAANARLSLAPIPGGGAAAVAFSF